MINKAEFYRAVGDYFGVPATVEITYVHEDCYYREGCPTCGGTYEFMTQLDSRTA